MPSHPHSETPDTMERVRDADPLAGARHEATDRVEADAVLRRILAEPPAAPRERSRPLARRPRSLAAAAVLCLAAAGLAASNLLGNGRAPTIADRAYAAVSDDDVIYHYVLDLRGSAHPLQADLRELLPLVNGRLEVWYRADGTASRSLQSERDQEGRLRLSYESAVRRGHVIDYDARKHALGRRSEYGGRPGATSPLDDFRSAYRDGKVLERGKTTFNGRPAYRLLIRRQGEGFRQRMAYYVDRETYLPLGTRESGRYKLNGGWSRIRVESRYAVYERLRDTRASRRLLRMGRHPGARRVDGPAILAP